jgi:hypothetical protein
MTLSKRIEHAIVRLHKNVPHTPNRFRQWFAENAWRVNIIGAGLSIYSLFVLIPMIMTAVVLTSSSNIIAPHVPYYSDWIGLPWVALLTVAIVFFTTAIILAVSVYPMIEMHKRGWDLTFRAYVMNVVLGIVTTLLFPSLLELIILVVVTFGAGYLLFEIRRESK